MNGAVALASYLGVEEVLILATDPASGTLIPAVGMPQTIRGGRAWRSFRSSLEREGRHKGTVDLPTPGLRAAVACVSHGAAIVLLGGSADATKLAGVEALLPLLASTLNAEQRLMAASAEAVSAAEVANRSRALASALERARSDAARLNSQLRAEDLAKDEFLATLAHELRNPLSGIRVSVSALQSRAVDDASKSRLVQAIDRQSRQLARLVDDLLDASRIRHGRIVLQLERVELRSAVSEAVELNRHVADAKGQEIEVSLGDVDLFVMADPTRLLQIVVNIFVNACKYTDRGGRVSVGVTYSTTCARVQIADTGIGIDAEMLPRIFELFTQAPVAIKQAQGGLGIGLSLVKRLVDLHSGQISASSPGRGLGSVFTVCIPLATANDKAG
ncbi:MAG: HAMP domain-containing histidine kinase [Pseudomonadota bacterium]|nr:HAMP domain-containing histidine kinase [Pseudomonadota bacterium]